MKKTVNTLLAGAVALTIAGASSDALAGPQEGFEKCYGVVKTGQNGCGSADGAHSCAGQATEDGSVNEWIALPTGVCDKIVGGTTVPGGEKTEG